MNRISLGLATLSKLPTNLILDSKQKKWISKQIMLKNWQNKQSPYILSLNLKQAKRK